jgi:TPR repeat protein
VEKFDREAFQWWQMAADKGLARAQFNLGKIFEEGRGVAQSDEEAVRWFEKAADQGDSDAQLRLAKLLFAGRGTCGGERGREVES